MGKIGNERSLASELPQIVAEWDYKKNDKGPDEYKVGSNKKVHWICPRGHRYSTRIEIRTRMGCGCPYCAGKLPIKGETDLLSQRPDIAAEWDYERNKKSPDEYCVGSGQKVYWICDREHRYYCRIIDRTSHGTGCPYCSGRYPILGETDLLSQRPEIAAEWDYEKNDKRPENYTACSGQYAYWLCPRGHQYKTRISKRTASGRGCPYCAHQLPIKGETDLLSQRPDIAAEWDYERNYKGPDEYNVASVKKAHWICPRGHRYYAHINRRSTYGTGCPYCAHQLPIKGETDLLSQRPDIAAEWDYERNFKGPDEYCVGSNRHANWICSRGHRYRTVIANRTLRGSGCPDCWKEKQGCKTDDA